MQNPHGFQQQQHAQMYQANQQQLLQAQQQQGQQMPQAMYGIPQQHGTPQQYLQQQAMQGTRAASQGLPQQQLPGLHGLQHHSRQHQQPAADNNQDEGFDIMDIPSDDDDGAAAPAPVGRPLAPAAQQQQSSSGQQGALHPGLALPQQHQQQFVPTHAQLQQQLAASGRAGVAPQPQQQQQHQQARMGQLQQQLQQPQALGQRPSQPMPPAATPNRHMSNVHAPRQGLQQAPSLPGANLPAALQQQQQLAVQQKHLQQLQQQALARQNAAALGAQAAAAGRPATAEPLAKRPKTDALPPPPEDAVSLESILMKAERSGVLKQAAGAGAAGVASSSAAAAAAAGSAADGPSSSIDDIMRRAEQQAATARARGLDRGAGEEEEKMIPKASLKRLMQLQALNTAFKLQPDLVDQLQQLTESFVSEAVKFGVDLASHRRGATLRPTDLAMYLERTHHLHVPGFTKEYHPYRRPVASELHKERSIAVRKAQLAAAAAGGDAPAAAAARGGGGGD